MASKRLLSALFLVPGLLTVSTLANGAESGQRILNNTPKFAAAAKNLGAEDPSTVIDVSIWLNAHNRSELDSLAKDLYDPTSPNYRHWLTKAELSARFAPTAKEAKTVQEFFTAHNLKIVTVGPNNFFVRARGTVASVKSAFNVEINKYQINGKTFRGNVSDPYVAGEAGPLVGAIYGLDNLEFTHPNRVQPSAPLAKTSPKGFKSAGAAAGAGPTSNFFASNCFPGIRTETFTGGGITATYKGNGYTKSVEGCGYTPAEIHSAYNLNALYKEGFDGTGQTIVILDWCGSPTITQDANAFSAEFGLPKLTASNFNIIYTPTPSTCMSPDPEINIDVEWAHAIAPGAAITLVVPPSASFQDVDEGYFYAVNYQLGNSFSGSYGSEELYTDPTVLITENLISEIAAVSGISANFSSGDDGDFTFDFPQFDPPSVSAPADSPWVTSVGGVSLALTSANKIAWQTGWGNNQTLLIDEGAPFDPALNLGFVFGAGGGPSAFFDKPSYQKKLKGTSRQVPDISWLADPYTGGVIAISLAGFDPTIQYQVYGGTSLACPMFAALWAIANQEAGAVTGNGLGQAAPYLYSMPAGTITDVLPVSSVNNVTGKIVDSMGTTSYSAAVLAAPLENTTKFYSALWDIPLDQDITVILTFGTDSGLVVTPGWDNVTGLGTPNGKAFADYFKP